MICANLYVFVFLGNAARDVELACLGVEIEGCHTDGESGMDAGAGGTAGTGFSGDAADCGGTQEVKRSYQVICVPLRMLVAG